MIAAAFDVIATDGFEGLRMREIAARVGADHSTIHHYFASKEALVEAVATDATGRFRGTTPDTGSATERLIGHLANLATRIVEEPKLHIVMRELDLRANRDPALRATLNDLERGWRQNLHRLLEQAASQGTVVRSVSPDDTAELIIAAAKGASLDPSIAQAAMPQLTRLLIQEPADSQDGEGT
jgi:AcrR family transcriptional regulator